MARTKRPKPSTPRPHPMAQPLDEPCAKCGSEWGRVGVMLDPDAEELEMPLLCANPACKHRVGESS